MKLAERVMGKRGVALALLMAACGGDDDGGTEARDGGGNEDAGAERDAQQDAQSCSLTETLPPGVASGRAKDSDCDMTGVWIARQVTESAALTLPQYASTWYYLVVAQNGEEVVITEHMDCGIQVRGTVNVQIKPATTRALAQHNRQIGRKGTFSKQSDGTCALSFDRFWSVRGVNECEYLPSPRNASLSIAELQQQKPLPTSASQAEDWDGDGKPGTAWSITGIVSGERHSAQRDWIRWFTAPGYTIAAAEDFASDVTVRAEFSNEETVYEADNPSLRAVSTPSAEAEHTLTLRFLGRNKEDARVRAILAADTFDTCLNVQAALPAPDGLR